MKRETFAGSALQLLETCEKPRIKKCTVKEVSVITNAKPLFQLGSFLLHFLVDVSGNRLLETK